METEPLRIFQKIHLDTIFLSALSDEDVVKPLYYIMYN